MRKFEYDEGEATILDEDGSIVADVNPGAAFRDPKLGVMIAAAPDMLRALEDALHCALFDATEQRPITQQMREARVSQLRAIIAKAKGKA